MNSLLKNTMNSKSNNGMASKNQKKTTTTNESAAAVDKELGDSPEDATKQKGNRLLPIAIVCIGYEIPRNNVRR